MLWPLRWCIFRWRKRFIAFAVLVGTDWWHILQAVLMSKTLPYNRCRGTFWQRFPQLWRMKRVYFQLLSITSSIWVCKTSLLWSKRGRAAKDVAFLQACVLFALQPFDINWSYRLLFVAMRIVIIDSRKIYPKVHSLSPLCALLYAGVHYLCEHNPNLPPCRAGDMQRYRQRGSTRTDCCRLCFLLLCDRLIELPILRKCPNLSLLWT